MKYVLIILISLFHFSACGQSEINKTIINKNGKTIASRFNPPAGFERLLNSKNSYAYFLSNFELFPIGTLVKYYNGTPKVNQQVAASVLKIDVGNKDLQQCADAIMRLRAEYLFEQNLFKQIHFNFTNGFKADYVKWAEGNRIIVNGNKVSWAKKKGIDYSYANFKLYLQTVFTYAGTLSLNKELKSVSVDSIQVGDVFIQGGSPGHAVIVVNVAINKQSGKRVFMLAQSYMPAQNIHVLVNTKNENISPWYHLLPNQELVTPEWIFDKNSLKRF